MPQQRHPRQRSFLIASLCRPQGRRGAAGRALADRRGISALLFAATGVAFLGFVGLGAQAGAWYWAKRAGQNAADAAALSGALALFWADYPSSCSGGSTAGTTAAAAGGAQGATLNGFTSGANNVTVAISNPPASGRYTSQNCYVQAAITQTQPSLLAGLGGWAGNVVIKSVATASISSRGPVCLLLTGTGQALQTVGSASLTGSGCSFALNSTASNSVVSNNGGTITGVNLYSMGGCGSPCTGISAKTLYNQALPTANPYASLDAAVAAKYNYASCAGSGGLYASPSNYPSPATPLQPYPTIYCGINLGGSGGGGSMQLAPGVYVLVNDGTSQNGAGNGNLALSNNWSMTCPTCTATGAGVTFVFLGSNNGAHCAGSINLSGGVTLTLHAGSSYANQPEFDGILFYQDPRCASGSPAATSLSNGTSITLAGGMDFSAGQVTLTGSGSFNTTCTEMIAASLSMSNAASTTFNVSGCAGYGTTVAQLSPPLLME